MKSLAPVAREVLEGLPDYPESHFKQSDHWMGRTISCLIKLGWDEDEVSKRAELMATIIKKEL